MSEFPTIINSLANRWMHPKVEVSAICHNVARMGLQLPNWSINFHLILPMPVENNSLHTILVTYCTFSLSNTTYIVGEDLRLLTRVLVILFFGHLQVKLRAKSLSIWQHKNKIVSCQSVSTFFLTLGQIGGKSPRLTQFQLNVS